MSDLLQILGALAILTAFIAVQLRLTEPTSFISLVLNLAGSALLGVLAAADQQWGFLLLEGCWALVSAWSLARKVLRRTAPAT